jgi:hypothetical protein
MAVYAYVIDSGIEEVGSLTCMLVVTAAASCDYLVHILFCELCLIVTHVTKFGWVVEKKLAEVRPVRIVTTQTVARCHGRVDILSLKFGFFMTGVTELR